jgi:hypothetical protein
MKAINFPEKSCVIGVKQDEYQNLPAYVDQEQAITKWKLSFFERLYVLIFGVIWVRQLTFNKLQPFMNKLQPQLLQVDYPFNKQDN